MDEIRVLHVEDEFEISELASNLLSKSELASFSLVWADTLDAAVFQLEQGEPGNFDAMLLDLHLPDGGGLETISKMHQQAPKIPIVVLTGETDRELVKGALAAGADDFLIKNEMSTDLLSRSLLYTIERRKSREALEQNRLNLAQKVAQRTAQLEQARTLWEKTFDAVPDLISVLDKDHRIIRCNRAMARYLGLNPAEVLGQHCHQLMHGTPGPHPACPTQKTLVDGKEHILHLTDGEMTGDFLISTTPLFQEDGEISAVVHVARNVTELKRLEKEATGQLNFLKIILDTIPNPVYFKDKSGKYTGCNQAFEDTFGIRKENLLGKTVLDLVSVAPAQEYRRMDDSLWESPGVQVYESSIVNANGEKRDVTFYKATYDAGDGKPSGMVGVILDITEARQASKLLQQSEKRHRLLVEALNEGLTQVDSQGKLTFVNDRFKEMTGYSREELLGQNVSVLLDEDNQKVLEQQLAKRRAGIKDSYELVWCRKDGGRVPSLVSATPVMDENGGFAGSVGLVTDVSIIKKLEQQLNQAQKLEAIGQLAAGIAHEINTPTQFVSGNMRFLKDAFDDLSSFISTYEEMANEFKDNESYAAHIAKMRDLAEEIDLDFLLEDIPKALKANLDGLDRIAKIVLSMKQFAHPGGSMKEPNDINMAIENTVTVARNEWKYVADVKLGLSDDLPPVPCVLGEINQVVLNLIVNAAQAIADVVEEGVDEKGEIAITTRMLDGEAEITVADTGPGVPEALRGKVFDPFFTTKQPGKGTGQGLAIAYRCIVESHGGSLSVANKPEGGAVFTIRLPLDTAPE